MSGLCFVSTHLSEGHSSLSAARGERQRPLTHPDQPHAVVQPPGSQPPLRDLEPATFPEQLRVFYRHDHVFKRRLRVPCLKKNHVSIIAHTKKIKINSPCGASSYPNTGNGLTTVTPLVRIGTSTIVCWRCFGTPGVPSGVVFPMKIANSHRGSHAPLVHHFRPLITYESPLRTMELVTFVASDDATAGSVMAKHDRIVPSKSGLSHRRCCSSVPYRRSTSMFPCK